MLTEITPDASGVISSGNEIHEHHAMQNKPDEANPAMTLWLTIEDQRRRVADLGR